MEGIVNMADRHDDEADAHAEARIIEKVSSILTEYGLRLTSIPLPNLKSMFDQGLERQGVDNVFAEIWNRHHLMPTAKLLRQYSYLPIPRILEVAQVMEEIWNDDV